MAYRATISFDDEIATKIKSLKNRSRIVNLALKQFYQAAPKKKLTENGMTFEEEQEILDAYQEYLDNPSSAVTFEEAFKDV